MSSVRNPPRSPLDHEPEAVTYARERAGLNKTQLADACDVSVSLISEIESGTRNATPSMIAKLAKALNCPQVVLERKHADEALLRAAVKAVTEQIDILRIRASHYTRGAEDTEGEPLRWAGFRGQAIAYEVAAAMIVDALAKTYGNPLDSELQGETSRRSAHHSSGNPRTV